MKEPFASIDLEVQLRGTYSACVTKQVSAIYHTCIAWQFTFPETSVQYWNVYCRTGYDGLRVLLAIRIPVRVNVRCFFATQSPFFFTLSIA
jgi:hypothetical protein